jgi:hypothetical protein
MCYSYLFSSYRTAANPTILNPMLHLLKVLGFCLDLSHLPSDLARLWVDLHEVRQEATSIHRTFTKCDRDYNNSLRTPQVVSRTISLPCVDLDWTHHKLKFSVDSRLYKREFYECGHCFLGACFYFSHYLFNRSTVLLHQTYVFSGFLTNCSSRIHVLRHHRNTYAQTSS